MMDVVQIHSFQEAQDLAAKLQNDDSSVGPKALSIQIPADKALLDAYGEQIMQHYANTELKESEHLAELAERRRQSEADIVGAVQAVLTTDLDHLEHVLPAWHVPLALSLAKCTNLTSLALQWRFDEPFNRLAERTDVAVYDDFATSLYDALSTLSKLQRLRLSMPTSPFHFSGALIKRVLADAQILPHLRTLDLTHCAVDCATVVTVLGAHPEIEHLILDQGPTWSEPDEDEGCMDDEDEEPEAQGPPTAATLVKRLGYGWASFGAYVALNPRLALRGLSAANVDVPMQMFTAPLTVPSLREKLLAGAEAVATCEDVPSDIRASAVRRVEALVLCDTWPVAYAEEEVYGPEKKGTHAAGCAHLAGHAQSPKPRSDVWPDKSPEELSYIHVF